MAQPKNIEFDKKYFRLNENIEYLIGLDEAGRGPLAGPLLVALFVTRRTENNHIKGITDSKNIPENKREILYKKITNSENTYWDYLEICPKDIDETDIYSSTLRGMNKLIEKLPNDISRRSLVLTDAMDLKIKNIPFIKIIKGDLKSYTIGAASIIAKVIRDRIMKKLSKKYPKYGFNKNKGYGTKEHIAAIEKFGPTPHHRMSFKPLKKDFSKKLDL